MPYIDSTPKNSSIVFEEDNLQEMFAKLLTDNGWVVARTFYKAAVDTRAYLRKTDHVGYAIAKHTILQNADGVYFGIASVSQFTKAYRTEVTDPIRRPGDDTDPSDENYQIMPTWEDWVMKRFSEVAARTNLYFYTLEKLPNASLAPEGEIISIVTMPGMSRTSYELERDADRENWSSFYYGYFGQGNSDSVIQEFADNEDSQFYDGKIMAASPYHMIRSVLDIEVLGTEWQNDIEEAVITKTDSRVMQSPVVKTTLRGEFIDYVDNPVWHTNWWTDSEVRVRGHVDSRTIALILQADNAPMWTDNVVPTIPLYFGKINSLSGNKDEGYALFSGTVPPSRRVQTERPTYTTSESSIYLTDTSFRVVDSTKLPEPPAMLTLGGKEIVRLVEKEGDYITIERGLQGTEPETWSMGTTIARVSTISSKVENKVAVSIFDFDDPTSKVGETIYPLLKTYPNYPSNGVDSVLVTRSRFGARYQAHYLSWNAQSNAMPPTRSLEDGRKYPRAYEPVENTMNYKYQFNASRYSDKIHSSRVYVVHPEEGVRGYLDNVIGFNSQGLNVSNLRVRKQNCPEKIYEMYKYLSVGAVSPLTKLPATPFRPIGLGIYSEDLNPNAEPYDPSSDATPPGEVTITSVVSPQTQTLDIQFVIPEDKDFSHVNIYVDDVKYAKGVTRTDFYRITGLRTESEPVIKVTTVDLAGNESVGVTAATVKVV